MPAASAAARTRSGSTPAGQRHPDHAATGGRGHLRALRHLRCERGEQGLAARRRELAQAAQVTLEAAVGDQRRERRLRHDVAAEIRRPAREREPRQQLRLGHHVADPHTGEQRLEKVPT